MNATLGLSLICFISFATIAKSVDLPPIAIPGEGALISSHQIFDLTNNPTALRTANGLTRPKSAMELSLRISDIPAGTRFCFNHAKGL